MVMRTFAARGHKRRDKFILWRSLLSAQGPPGMKLADHMGDLTPSWNSGTQVILVNLSLVLDNGQVGKVLSQCTPATEERIPVFLMSEKKLAAGNRGVAREATGKEIPSQRHTQQPETGRCAVGSGKVSEPCLQLWPCPCSQAETETETEVLGALLAACYHLCVAFVPLLEFTPLFDV